MLTDLNLLRVLDAVLVERSVTRAGRKLGLSQSAVSHALGRLRYALGDELLVRGPNGMRPTPRALELGPQVNTALAQLQAALAPKHFDPATQERRFPIVAGAYACAVVIPQLVERLTEIAPGCQLDIHATSFDMLDRLEAGAADFVIGGAISPPPRFLCEEIFSEDLAWVVRAGHPLARADEVTLEMLAATPQVVIKRRPIADQDDRHRIVASARWEESDTYEAALAAAGLPHRIGVTVPDTYTALVVVSRTDMAATIPRGLALRSAQSGRLAFIDPPYDAPEVSLQLVAMRERLNDPAIRWMRDLITEAAATSSV